MGYLELQSQYQRHLRLLSHLFNKLYEKRGKKVTLMLWFCLLSWLRCPLMLNFHKVGYNLNIFLYLLKLLRRLNSHALHGTMSPYITGLTQGLAQSEQLIPYDSEIIARTCLSTSEFLKFQTWWQGEASQQAQRNTAANLPLNITVEQLMGSGALSRDSEMINL